MDIHGKGIMGCGVNEYMTGKYGIWAIWDMGNTGYMGIMVYMGSTGYMGNMGYMGNTGYG